MAKYKVVMTDDRHKTYNEEKKVLESVGAEVIIADCKNVGEVASACADADGILVNLAPMPAEVIDKLQKCKVISRYGVGYDNVDVNACSRRKIYVANVPDYCAEEVSDHALALLMGGIRKIVSRDSQVRKGRWNIGASDPIYRTAGKVFTFLGFGSIARCLFRKIKGFGFSKILVYDPYLDEDAIKSYGAYKAGWEEALKEADYLSVHMPLNDKTKGIINSEAFSLMKNTSILINTSRGPVIDEEALIEALKTGKISYAGLDVHNKEPIDSENPLLKLENCILTDHMGWYSEESTSELKTKAAENIRDVLLGAKPRYLVNAID